MIMLASVSVRSRPVYEKNMYRHHLGIVLLCLGLLGADLNIASAQTPREAWWNLVSVDHDSRTVTIVGKGHLCHYDGTWTLAWGDGSTETVTNQWYQNHSHTYAQWGAFTIKLSYQCSGYDADTYSDSVTLVQPTATPTATLEPLTVEFTSLRVVSGRLFIMTSASSVSAGIVCTYSGAISGELYCPHRTLVHIAFAGCGTVTVTATATAGSRTASVSQDVVVSCSPPTATPTPPPEGVVYIAVASQNDPNRSVAAAITHEDCTGTGTWSLDWGDDESTSISSSYFGQQTHTYSDWGIFDINLAYTCQGGSEADAKAAVALQHPTPTNTPTATATATSSPTDTPVAESRHLLRAGATPNAAGMIFPAQDHTCLPAGALVTSDSPWIQFCEVSGDAISDARVREAALSAIDVWGPLGVDAEVCFDGSGSLLLLEAAYAPRAIIAWPSYAWAGMTCARLDRAGTLVLMPGRPSVVITATVTLLPPTATEAQDPNMIADNMELITALENCQIGSLYTLNFRESPAGPIMRWFNGVANALARTPNWFQVVDHGEVGWVNAHYVSAIGDCG